MAGRANIANARRDLHNHDAVFAVFSIKPTRSNRAKNHNAGAVHDYHDINTGVLASSLAKRAPGYLSLGFPDPRKARG